LASKLISLFNQVIVCCNVKCSICCRCCIYRHS